MGITGISCEMATISGGPGCWAAASGEEKTKKIGVPKTEFPGQDAYFFIQNFPRPSKIPIPKCSMNARVLELSVRDHAHGPDQGWPEPI